MNKKDAFLLLKKYLDEYTFDFHPRFFNELSKLLASDLKGKEGRFFKLLVTQLKNMQTFGVMVHTVDSNEKLHAFDGHFYSIHLQQSQFNIRILVHISDYGKCILLCAFYERGGKKSTDYTNYISVLHERLKDMEAN